MRSAPKIIVLGPTGSGKSSLAMLLQELLSTKGINAVVTDSDSSDEEAVRVNWRERVKNLEGQIVKIVTLQSRHKP